MSAYELALLTICSCAFGVPLLLGLALSPEGTHQDSNQLRHVDRR